MDGIQCKYDGRGRLTFAEHRDAQDSFEHSQANTRDKHGTMPPKPRNLIPLSGRFLHFACVSFLVLCLAKSASCEIVDFAVTSDGAPLWIEAEDGVYKSVYVMAESGPTELLHAATSSVSIKGGHDQPVVVVSVLTGPNAGDFAWWNNELVEVPVKDRYEDSMSTQYRFVAVSHETIFYDRLTTSPSGQGDRSSAERLAINVPTRKVAPADTVFAAAPDAVTLHAAAASCTDPAILVLMLDEQSILASEWVVQLLQAERNFSSANADARASIPSSRFRGLYPAQACGQFYLVHLDSMQTLVIDGMTINSDATWDIETIRQIPLADWAEVVGDYLLMTDPQQSQLIIQHLDGQQLDTMSLEGVTRFRAVSDPPGLWFTDGSAIYRRTITPTGFSPPETVAQTE